MASSDDASKPTLVERMRAQREIHLNRPLYLRVLIAGAGFTLLVAGLAMLVLPGPALADTTERPGALVEVRDFIGEG